jgi:hypothetical protein
LAFADQELAVERLRGERARADLALTERVLSALFKWQRALLRSKDPSLEPEQRLLHSIEAAEAEVLLDVLTGGWFSSAVTLGTAGASPATLRRPASTPRPQTARPKGGGRKHGRKDAPPVREKGGDQESAELGLVKARAPE